MLDVDVAPGSNPKNDADVRVVWSAVVTKSSAASISMSEPPSILEAAPRRPSGVPVVKLNAAAHADEVVDRTIAAINSRYVYRRITLAPSNPADVALAAASIVFPRLTMALTKSKHRATGRRGPSPR